MRNFKKIITVFGILTALPILGACSSMGSKGFPGPIFKPTEVKNPVRIELKGDVGRKEINSYFSHAMITDFENGQAVRDREEVVEFQVETEITKGKIKGGLFAQVVRTLRKDGPVDLHDFAFPEKGEELEYHLSPQGKIYKAGDYPTSSLFFVPPLPLPDEEVKVGDTWSLQHTWVTSKNNLPLQIDVAAILKNLYKCGKGGELCADLEISGNVDLVNSGSSRLRFTSEIWGRMIFALKSGSIIWSEVQSREEFVLPDSHVAVNSCMSSKLDNPKGIDWPIPEKLKCVPHKSAVEAVPGIASAN